MEEHRNPYGSDRDRCTNEPLPVIGYEVCDERRCPYLDVDDGFPHRDALVF
jgi:hypothetical protein